MGMVRNGDRRGFTFVCAYADTIHPLTLPNTGVTMTNSLHSRFTTLRRWSPVLVFCLLLLSSLARTSAADDSDFVGVLSLAIEPEVVAKLELSDDVKTKLAALIDKRVTEATDLALSLRNESIAAQQAKMRPFVLESEKQGRALLTYVQWNLLEQFRMQTEGLITLQEDKVAEAVKLTDEQREQVNTWVSERDDQLKRLTSKDQMTTLQAIYERKFFTLLSDEQRIAWEQLAGASPAEAPATTVADDTTTLPEPPATGPTTVVEAPAPPTTEPETDVAPPTTDVAATPTGPVKLRFSFRYAPWKDVIDWFAQQDKLSLVADSMPEGTFNYSDTRSYSPGEAIDLLNSVLLTKGFTLVRRDKMLMLVNLEDGIPPNLVPQVSLEDLDSKGEFELVSCLFPLNEISAEDAEREVSRLLGPQGAIVVLPKAKQIFVTETAGKLRTIRRVLTAAETPAEVATPSKVEEFVLKHVTAEDVLIVARQLLGLGDDENAAADGSIRIAVDPLGTRLLVTGNEETLTKLVDVLNIIDVPADFTSIEGGPIEMPQLEVYSVTEADPTTVLQVMQTLMSGLPDVRLASDPIKGNLVALARPTEHKTIKATLDQMQKDAKQVEVIRLNVVDPQLAVLSINKLFGSPLGEEGVDPKSPIVDADPTTRQLFLRATESQITQIRSLLEKMGESPEADGPDASGRGNVRILPLYGRSAQSALDQLQTIWPTMRRNRVRVVTPSARSGGIRTKRSTPPPTDNLIPNLEDLLLPPAAPQSAPPAQPENSATETKAAFVEPPQPRFTFAVARNVSAGSEETEVAQVEKTDAPQPPAETKPAAEIVVSFGPSGLMIASEDLEALDEFEAMLTTLSAQSGNEGDDYTVFYLKYARAEVAANLLNTILGNGGGDGGGGGGSLLGDLASNMLGGGGGGGLMGSLLGLAGGGGGGGIVTAGSITITPDNRLNALVIQAGPQDLDLVEQMLEIIDQEASPEDVQTVAKPRLIPIFYSRAEDIATVVKSVYSSRLESSATSRQRQPSPEELIKALRGGKGGGRSSNATSTPQKMSVGIDARSNSLVVSAPEKLFQEVKMLVEQLDQAGTESMQDVKVVTLKRSNPQTIQHALSSLLGDSVVSNANGSNGKSKGDSSKKSGEAEARNAAAANEQMRDQIRKRIEFFNNIQRGSGGQPSQGARPSFGGGGGRPGSGGGRPSPGGGRPGGR